VGYELGSLLLVVGVGLGYLIAQDRRITRLEERVRGIGHQLVTLPKRRGDGHND